MTSRTPLPLPAPGAEELDIPVRRLRYHYCCTRNKKADAKHQTLSGAKTKKMANPTKEALQRPSYPLEDRQALQLSHTIS